MWHHSGVIPHSRPHLTTADLDAVRARLETGMIACGDLVAGYERAFADHVGAAGAVATASGTAALALGLRALDVGPGDEVVMPTYVCRSVADAIVSVGATPVLCDVGSSWLMTVESAAPHVTERTRAVVVVHLFGISADTAALGALGVPIVEDACQALGARHPQGANAEAGRLAFFSSHATKCFTTGEGGLAVSRDAELVTRMRDLLARGAPPAPSSDLAAALGMSQLARYEAMLARRAALAARYLERLPPAWTRKVAAVADRTMWFRMPLDDVGPFEAVAACCADRGVSVRRGVDALLHRGAGLDDSAFPNAVRCFDGTVSIPLYPALSDRELDRVVAALESC